MYVYFTVDTEFWPRDPRCPDFAEATEDFERDVLGMTREGEFGIRYQMDALNAEGLKGVFFIESLHTLKLGGAYLREIVHMVRRRGHEVGLHLHPEWLGWADHHPFREKKNSPLMKAFGEVEQRWMIHHGAQLLRNLGVDHVKSFRAGNYGADYHTLRGLAAEGIGVDSSYNVAFLDGVCGLTVGTPLTGPRVMEGVIEVPIAFVRDYPGHYRPMQITAVSFPEMCAALECADAQGFPSFVFVCHGFEMIRRRTHLRGGAQMDSIVRRRFDALIQYLGRNKDRYQVTTFAETVPARLFHRMIDESPIKGSTWRTSGRVIEQLVRRVLA